MYYCDSCGARFETPKIIKEKHGMDWGPYEEVPVCLVCNESMMIKMVKCSCCGEYTPQRYVRTDDGRIYCDECFVMEEPEW